MQPAALNVRTWPLVLLVIPSLLLDHRGHSLLRLLRLLEAAHSLRGGRFLLSPLLGRRLQLREPGVERELLRKGQVDERGALEGCWVTQVSVGC